MLGVDTAYTKFSTPTHSTPGESEQALYGSQIDRRRSGALPLHVYSTVRGTVRLLSAHVHWMAYALL